MVSPAAAERFLETPLLAEMDAASRAAMLNVMVEQRAKEGETLLEQGQPNDHMAFLIEGTATVYRDTPRRGRETLTNLTAPTLFGLTSFFRPTPPNFSVKATSDVWFLTLDRPALAILRRVDLSAAEQLALSAVRVLADRFDMLDKKISDDLAKDPENRAKANEWADFRSRLFEETNA